MNHRRSCLIRAIETNQRTVRRGTKVGFQNLRSYMLRSGLMAYSKPASDDAKIFWRFEDFFWFERTWNVPSVIARVVITLIVAAVTAQPMGFKLVINSGMEANQVKKGPR